MSKEQKKYQFTADMAEISGFGGAYEEACRAMVIAGLEWLDANPKADPQFKGIPGVHGILMEDNDCAKQLSAAVVAACDDCTGSMVCAAISNVMWIKWNGGWDAYCKESKEVRKQREAAK